MTEEKVRQIADFENGSFSPREKLALAYAESFIVAPQSMTDRFFEDMKEHFTEGEIVEMSFFLGFYNMIHRFNAAIDLQHEDRQMIKVESIGRLLASKGPPPPAEKPRERAAGA